MKILIDNGHGLMTAGKRSPDGLFREAFYNREIARKVVADLLDKNLDAELLVPDREGYIPCAQGTAFLFSVMTQETEIIGN